MTQHSPTLPPGIANRKARIKINQMEHHTKRMNESARSAYQAYKDRVGGINSDLLRGLYTVRPANGNLPVVVMAEERLMTAAEESAIIKTVFSNKQLNMLHICNSKKLGLDNESFEIRLGNKSGRIIAIVLRDALTLSESLQSLLLSQCHDSESSWWTNGCEADVRPTGESVIRNLKDPKIMHSSGLNRSNVVKIKHTGPLHDDGSGRPIFVYENKTGETITRPFCAALNRHKWACNGKRSIESAAERVEPGQQLSLLSKVKQLYQSNIQLYLSSKGFNNDMVMDCLSSLDESMTLSTLRLSSRNQLAVHRDPPTPMPACSFGMTIHTYNVRSKCWDRTGKGGQLYLMNGLFNLEYSPRDVVLWDGNMAHGVSTIVRRQSKDEHFRFSALLFSNWRRERGMKRPGNYDGTGTHIRSRSNRVLGLQTQHNSVK